MRTSRPRFWGEGLGQDKLCAYHTLYAALKALSLVLAPFAPFLAEAMWRNLRTQNDPESVHLADWPEPLFRDLRLEEQMARVRSVVELGLAARNRAKVKVRQPLRLLLVQAQPEDFTIPSELWLLAKEELNVLELRLVPDLGEARVPRLIPDFRRLGPRLGPTAQEIGRLLREADPAWAKGFLAQGQAELLVNGERVTIWQGDVQVTW
ncbi:MAG: class I tRNA ligase family protein, partial [Candidatus Bipolaricaulaceae bacterium]